MHPAARSSSSSPSRLVRVLDWYRRAVDALDRATLGFCTFLLATVVVLSGAEIVGRTFFAASSVELVDLSLQLSILMNFIGYLVLLNRDQDISVDYFYVRLPRPVRRAIDILIALAIAAFFLLLLIKSIALFRMGLRFNHPVFPIPQAILAVPAVLGSAGGLIVAIRNALDVAVDPRDATERNPVVLD
jgi:TRAP-type C4-dicarboxylate transport system permease small subunit